jgi:TonB family protein
MPDNEVVIEVEALVDAAGAVRAVKSLTMSDSVRKSLSGLALDAARRWQFEPGRLNGQPVEARAVISFRFSKPPRR